MKSLFKVLWEFLRSIFGGKKDNESGNGKDKDKDPTQGPGGQGTVNPSTRVELVRFDIGAVDTLGKLYYDGDFVCFTLEQTTDRADLGEYPLILRKQGGLHATYGFRFQKIHKGVLQLDIPASQQFRFIRTGNLAADSGGGMVVGKVIQGQNKPQEAREVWNSEDAYLDFYPKIANRVENGEKMTIRITLDTNG